MQNTGWIQAQEEKKKKTMREKAQTSAQRIALKTKTSSLTGENLRPIFCCC